MTSTIDDFKHYPSVISKRLTAQAALDIKEDYSAYDEPMKYRELSTPLQKIIFLERQIQMTGGLRMGVMHGKDDEKKDCVNKLAALYIANRVAPDASAAKAAIIKFADHWSKILDTPPPAPVVKEGAPPPPPPKAIPKDAPISGDIFDDAALAKIKPPAIAPEQIKLAKKAAAGRKR